MPLTPEEALARCVVGQYLQLRRTEVVVVEAWSHALPWARAFVAEARRRGAQPILTLEDEETFFRAVAPSRRVALPGAADALATLGNAYVYLGGPEEFPRLFGLPGAERARLIEHHGPGWRLRATRRQLRAVRPAVAEATSIAATRYGVDPAVWRRELLEASLVPPGTLRRALLPWLRRGARGRRVRIRHPNGTDLSLALEPRRWRAEVGAPARGGIWIDVPTGVLLLPLRSEVTEGTWEGNRANFDRFRDPPVTSGGRFTFREGRLRNFEFDRGGEGFARAYANGATGRERAAALTIGLNPKIDRAPECPELAAGSLGLLIGDNLRAGGHRAARFSYLSVLAGADVELDGRPWATGGRLTGVGAPGSPTGGPRRVPSPSGRAAR